MKTRMDRVPKELSEYLAEEAKKQGTSKTQLYKQIELALKGVQTIDQLLRGKKSEKPPFAF